MTNSRSVTGVIVADDDPMIRSVLRSKLEAIDQVVFLASNGLEAVKLASRMQAALILLDLQMPLMNGLLACQRIRQMPGYAQTPIVVLTSHHGKDAEAAAERVGATTYLTKPFRTGLLLQSLAGFLAMEDETREEVYRQAARAMKIVRPSSILHVSRVPPTIGSNGPLDRGKNILAVLRG